ncbi:MAG: hypothetical protein N3A58_05290 [Spirochaetes bacterium]|nr:hypothetical protein [Spirochaetota bacterium]
MGIDKVYKILEHLGEGTISDIEKKISKESGEFLDTIKKDLNIEEDLEKELNLDNILGDDLKSLQTEEISAKHEEFESQQLPFIEEKESLEEEKIEEESLGEIEESGLGELESLMEFEKAPEREEVIGSENLEKQTIEEKIESKEEVKGEVEEIDISDLYKEEELDKSPEKETSKFEEQQFIEESELQKEEELKEEKIAEIEESELSQEEKFEFPEEEKIAEQEAFSIEESELTLDELGTLEKEKAEEKTSVKKEIPSYKDEVIDLTDLSEIAYTEEEAGKQEYDIELTDDDLEAIKTALKTYPVWLSKNIKNLILNDALSPDELKTLLDMLITFAPYKSVVNYLEKTLNIKVTPEAEVEEQIYIPSQFEILWPYIKWTAISFFTLMIFLVLFYFYIYIPQEAKKYYQIGYQALKEEKIEKAMENFRIATKTKLYPEWILKYADELINRKYFNIAIDILKNPGLVFYPDDIRFYFKISDALFEMGKTDEALKQLESLYANVKFAKDPRLYLEYAKKYERLGNYKDAIIVYQDGNRVIGERIEFLLGILKNYVQLKDLKSSDIYYNKIKKKDKNFIDEVVFTEYAFLLMRNNYDTEGKEIVELVLKKRKEYPKAYYFLGVYYIKRKDVNLSMKNLQIAERLVKTNKATENLLPYIYNLQGEIIINFGYQGYKDSSLASEKFNLAISEDKTFAKAYYNLGKIMYFEINDYKKAYEYMKLAKNYGYSSDYLDYILGWIEYQLGNYLDSLKTFIFLHNKYLDNVNLKHALGLNFIKLNQPELAIGYFQAAIGYWELNKYKVKKIDISNPDVRNTLLNLASLYNNIGVAYYNLYKETKNKDYANQALKYFLKSKEEYSWLNPNAVVNSESYINSLSVLHPDIKRDLFLMDSFQYFPKSIFEENDIFYY